MQMCLKWWLGDLRNFLPDEIDDEDVHGGPTADIQEGILINKL